MKTCRRLLFLLAISLLNPFDVFSQGVAFHEEYIGWEEFLEEFLEDYPADLADEDGEGTQGLPAAVIEELEELRQHPLNINDASRADLLQLPFMDEERVDSLLAYRERKNGRILTLGELLFVPAIGYDERRWLSLFIYAAAVPASEDRDITPRVNIWREGHHKVATIFSLPLYRMAGDTKHTAEEAQNSPNKYFEGLRWANATRWQYTYKRQLKYGVTLQKDSGEPFGLRGSHTFPFDYNSLHFLFSPQDDKYKVALGDYRVQWGQGLVVGDPGGWRSRGSLSRSMPSDRERITAHSSTEENRFLRGAAGQYVWSLPSSLTLRVMAFGSYRRLDGRLDGDTLTSFKTDGLHRTITEMDRRNSIDNVIAGTHLSLSGRLRRQGKWTIGAGGAWSHFSRVVWPAERPYNLYWLRGQDAAALSLDYSLRRGKWQTQGEIALDKHSNPAFTHTVRWQQNADAACYLQLRALSPRYVSPWGSALSQSSHLQNEVAALAGGNWRVLSRLQLEAYAEVFHFLRPVYRVSQPSTGMEGFAKLQFSPSATNTLVFSYKLKVRDRDVSGYDVQQHIGSHRLRAQWSSACGSVRLHITADGTAFVSQVESAKYGTMLSSRAEWKTTAGRVRRLTQSDGKHTLGARETSSGGNAPYQPSFKMGVFLGVFAAQSYEVRQYAYTPHLRYAAGNSSFGDNGVAATLSAEYAPFPWLQLGVQGNFSHFFNRSTAGSGLTETSTPTRTTALMQAVLLF